MDPIKTIVTTNPNTVEVTVADMKQHLAVYHDDDDAYIGQLTFVAQEIIHTVLGEFITTATVSSFYTGFNRTLTLGHNHVRSISSVTYRDTSDTVNTIAASMYVLDTTSDKAMLKLKSSQPAWTTDSLSTDYEGPVEVSYVSAIPATAALTSGVQHAIKLIVGDLYRDRENSTEAMRFRGMITAERILAPFKKSVL